MSFSSILFIFAFLPAFLILYILVKRSWYRNFILLIGSLIFFAWADPTHIHIIILSVIINYLLGLLIGIFQGQNSHRLARVSVWVGILVNLGMLFFYKYLAFFETTLNRVLQQDIEIARVVLPLGISYFTFSGISYLLDVYQQVTPAEKRFLQFSNYLVMFPKLLQGPITRYGQVKNELASLKISNEALIQGIRRFIIGLAKKVIIADSMTIVANKVFSTDTGDYGAGVAWVGIIAYTIQLFFDFSGYTDMAIGIGSILGLKLPENFNYPYISRSVSDFWRRWHMTLTAWFRTYVFIPLEYSRKKQKFLRQQTNLVIVFLLTGLWHGAGWNFVVWGIYYGIILALETGVWGKILKKAPRFSQHLYTLIIVIVGWVLFRINNISDWLPFISALFGKNGWMGNQTLRSLEIRSYLPLIFLGGLLTTPIMKNIEKWLLTKNLKFQILIDLILVVIFLISVIFLLSNGYQPFIYTQF